MNQMLFAESPRKATVCGGSGRQVQAARGGGKGELMQTRKRNNA